jgi:hypothetical protein
MADRQLLATTRGSAFQPRLSGGRPATEAWEQLHGFLAQALGAAHADLLAEPRVDTAAGSINWYGPAGAARPADAAGRRRRKTLMSDISYLADDLDRAGDESRRSLGRLLRQALSVPASAPMYCVGEQPVLIAWGHVDMRPTRRGSSLAAPAAVVVVLLLGAAAGWWLWRHLPVPAVRATTDPAETAAIATLHAAQDHNMLLRQRLDELRLQTAALRLQCPPPTPAAPKPPVSIFSPELKPSMPATPKRPVDVAPLAPPARQ